MNVIFERVLSIVTCLIKGEKVKIQIKLKKWNYLITLKR